MNKDKVAKIMPVLAAIIVVSVVIGCFSIKARQNKSEESVTADNKGTEIADITYTKKQEEAIFTSPSDEKHSETSEKDSDDDGDESESTTSKTSATQKVAGATYIHGVLIANKSYALPSDYAPGIDPEASSAFDRMAADADDEGIDLWIQSGYRSYSVQEEIYNNYVAQDGKAEADRYSARPGHSEHQTGLAFDVNSLSTSFEDTPEGKWLAQNCWKYGFIIRYPKGKESVTGYMYEPWHIRYLGEATAKAVYDSGLTLEEYLGIDSRYSD